MNVLGRQIRRQVHDAVQKAGRTAETGVAPPTDGDGRNHSMSVYTDDH